MEQALIGALNLVSRNLPLPPELFNTVSSICYGSDTNSDAPSNSTQHHDLFTDLQDALSIQRPHYSSSSKLNNAIKTRFLTRFHHRLTQLQGYYLFTLMLFSIFIILSYNYDFIIYANHAQLVVFLNLHYVFLVFLYCNELIIANQPSFWPGDCFVINWK